MAQQSPVMIWVVGDNTNVGKTTISAALIRALNAGGKATIGFKPYAGARLMDALSLLEEIAAGDGFLAGRDVRKLAEASPLMPNEWLEVANPSWRLTHPVRDAAVFLRKGAAAIGRRSFFHTCNAKACLSRDDFQHLNKFMRLPLESTLSIQDMPADQLDFSDQDVQRASFNRLLTLNPDIVVCEGAGRLLPVWNGAPAVRHLLFISAGDLYLFPNLGIRIPEGQSSFGPYSIGAILQYLKGKPHIKAPIPLLHPSALDAEMDVFIQQFAKGCF
ncbi:MAG: hypothetical protein Q7K57_46440 [Burkholderiaceae bacterium]|nr:hypothetical protein [Burkholderiaceae bacterium]